MLWLFLLSLPAAAQTLKPTVTRQVRLGETNVAVNIYEHPGRLHTTFFVPHHDETTGLELVKELIMRRGGRLVELVALRADGITPARNVRFGFNGAVYALDPNRVFTERGRICGAQGGRYPIQAIPAVKAFADELLKILLRGGNRLPEGEKFLVAVHNNSGVTETEAEGDLTAFGFVRSGKVARPLIGGFESNIAGVYLSNTEANEDNFLLVTDLKLFHQLAGGGFHVVLQQAAPLLLNSDACKVDDGSLSVYFGQHYLPYINIEAQRDSGRERQAQMLRTVANLVAPECVTIELKITEN